MESGGKFTVLSFFFSFLTLLCVGEHDLEEWFRSSSSGEDKHPQASLLYDKVGSELELKK